MTDRNKFEEMLEKLVNEDRAGAEELFHEIVVEKSRDIYENLLGDDLKENEEEVEETTEEEVDEATDDKEDDEEKVDEATDEEVDEATDEEVDEATDEEVEEDEELDEFEVEPTVEADPADDMMGDIEDAMDGDDEEAPEGDLEDRVVDLEDELDKLKAEFEKEMGDGDDEEGDEADDEGEDDMDMDDEGEEKEDESLDFASDLGTADQPAFEGDKSEAEQMREYVEKVTAKMGDNGDNTKSPVAGKNDMGGTSANIAKGSADEKGGSNVSAKEDNMGNVNVPGGKAGKAMKTEPKGHGAEKKSSGENADNKKSAIGS